ncbi:hypothetical protein [Akkermansia sp.]|uniref:hypothetical protein n=1 Tax=Akkermansia sp. TaxID=1872421 RepID=UPI00399C791C
MEKLRQELKIWLKDIGKNREWLGEKCGVKKRTVDSWFSWGTITEQTERHLRLLMAQYPATANTPATPPSAAENAVVLTVNDSTFDLWNRAATAEKKLLRQWCVDVITEHVTANPPPDSTE